MPPDSLVHNPVPTDLDHGQVLAQHLDGLYRQDEARRERQRWLQQQHAEDCGGECWCDQCFGDGPVLIGVVIEEAFAVRGIAAQPPVDTPAADVIAEPGQ